MDEKTDAGLVAESLAGRGEAFSALVRRYQNYAYGVAIGALSDFELARDVVQEAFLCAYRDLHKLKDPARFGGWLHGIVRYTAYRALRELERVQALAEELGYATETFAQTPSPDQSAEEAERREIVRRALERLNEKNREAVSLYYVDGLSYADIAEFLGVTEGAVQGRLQRARAQLREALKMIRKTFKEQELPEDFSAEIKRLLDAVATHAEDRERTIRRLAEIGAPAVDPLCRALEDARIPVRQTAAHALCAIGDPRALQPILRVLYTPEAWRLDDVFHGRVLAIPGMREALLRIVGEGRETEQGTAFSALSYAVTALSYNKGDREAHDRISECFRNADPLRSKIRYVALEALCRLSPESAVGFLTEALNGPDLRLRGLACWLAVSGGFLPPIQACLKAFVSGVNWWGRVCAANLVLKHGGEGQETLERLMRTGSASERCTAAMALARTGSEEAFEILKRELLGVKDRKWAKAVSRTLAGKYREELTEWIEAGGDRLTANIPAVVWTLARSRLAQAGPMVEEIFQDGSPSIRAAAARILARQREASFLPELRRCLAEGQPRKVAQEAFRQVLRLGDVALPTVEEMFNSERWTERKAAVCLLRRWGKLTPEQKARAENDPHIAVRQAVSRWIRATDH
jgi:RNA polymerase sigma-70 factor (ECF subfamily)